jgi:Mor family transcriptional regulator
MKGMPTAERNRQILAAYDRGESIESLCSQHRLRPTSLAAIIMAERHRRAFSPLPVYREARNSGGAN